MGKSSNCPECGEPLNYDRDLKSWECPNGHNAHPSDSEWLASRLEDNGDYLDRSFGPEGF